MAEDLRGSADEAAGPGRVEAILGGWWKRDEEKFRRCRTMDLGPDEGVIVLDSPLASGDEFELHLDIEAEWSVRLQARVLASRPIFFGKQHLTSVSYRFLKTSDRTMFGLWLQRQLADRMVGATKDYLKPSAPNPARQGQEPELTAGARLAFVEDRWRRALSSLKAKIPWREAAPVPDDRRCEHRGQVGLTLSLFWGQTHLPAELLNVSFSGACIFIEAGKIGRKGWPGLDERAEIVIPDSTLLMGSRRCPVRLVWSEEAKVADDVGQRGRALGLRFLEGPAAVKRTFVGDLLRRLRYDPKQVRKELRFPLRMPVQVTAGADSVLGQTLDLSAGGARLLLQAPVATPGDGFIVLRLPGAKSGGSLKLSVRFLREVAGPESGYCYAVAFRKAQPDAHLKLSRWLATRMRVQTLDELVPELASPSKSGATSTIIGDDTLEPANISAEAAAELEGRPAEESS